MKKVISIFAFLILLTGCSTPESEASEQLNIITTYYPYQLVTEELGGDFVNVESIYPQDSDAHSYELTPRQTIDLQEADLVIITNQEEDSKIYNILADKDNLLVLDPEDVHTNEDKDEELHTHSHRWLSPLRMIDDIDTITTRLIDIDDSNKLIYQENNSKLSLKLQTISDQYAKFGHEQTKPIIATHDAYQALDEDYEIEFVTLYGQHHDDEPTTKEVINTVDLIKKDNINTIFVEQDDTSNPVMRQIADETSTSVNTIYTLETQSSLKSFDSITDFYEYNLEMMQRGQQ